MQITGNEPAMPNTDGKTFCNDGLSIRQHIMIELMKAYISAGSTGMPEPEMLVQYASKATDALIAELNKTQP